MIARICEDLGLLRAQGAKRPRAPRQLKLFKKAAPGESVQVDVKVVSVGGHKAYQYTACDDCTRYRVLRLFRRQDTRTSLDSLAELRRVLPFPIQKVQTDHGAEFSFGFVLAVLQGGMHHRYIKPRRPQQNGKVERSHRIDDGSPGPDACRETRDIPGRRMTTHFPHTRSPLLDDREHPA